MMILLLLLVLSSISAVAASDRRREYHLIVAYAEDNSSSVLINGSLPGPLIEADLNDILVVRVTNNLPDSEELALHFHGMHFRGTPQMDGVLGITQMSIGSQQTFTYVFRAYPAGTFFYHSHTGLQSITAFGPLIVHHTQTPWDAFEVPSGPLIFSDLWYKPDRLTQEHTLLASPFVWSGEPTYLLINGQRDYVLTLEPDTPYVLRLIGATTLSTVVFGIDGHPMTVVEVDGTLIKPRENVASIELSSGQRYAVLIRTKKQTSGLFVMQLAIRWRALVNDSSCTGVLKYGSLLEIPANLSSLPQPTLSLDEDLRLFAMDAPYEPLSSDERMPLRSKADQEIFLYNYQAHTSDGTGIRWLTNNGSMDKMRLLNVSQPLLFDVYQGVEKNLPLDVLYPIERNQVIDMILQNTVALNGVCESHPFHLHGHKFWIHSQGVGTYNSSTVHRPQSPNPILRDTLTLHASAYSHTAPNRSTSNYREGCGWMRIRFIADNPGLWLFHCHIGSHFFMGMTIILQEDDEHLTMNFLSKN